MTMTLEEVRDWLRGGEANEGRLSVDDATLKELADAIDFHLSQPQPVAQGEAVAWLVTSEKAGKVSAELSEFSADAAIAEVVNEYSDAYGKTTKSPLFLNPAIPAGHRLVPVEPTEECVPLDFSKPMETEYGVPVKYVCADVIEVGLARVCVDQKTGLVYSSPHIDLRIRNAAPTGGG